MGRKIYQTVGLIASGKTTYSKKVIKEHPNIQRISRDDIRFMTTDYQYTPENEKIVDKIYRSMIETYLKTTDKNLILDEQNLNVERKEQFKKWVLTIDPNVEFVEIEFPITLAEAIERDSKRERPIGKGPIKQTWDKNEVYLKQMIERHKPKYPIDPNLPWCIICDIDGTLSNSVNRKIFDDTKVMEDLVIEPVKNILKQYEYTDVDIFLMSGRQDSCREITEQWLKANNIPYDALYMRKAGDNRKDTIIKRELFDEHIRGKYNVLFVIDDRPCVCKMWQELGLFTFVVNQDVYAKNDF